MSAALRSWEQIKSRVVDDSSAESFILCRLLGLISCPKFTDYVYEDYKGVYQPLISLTGARPISRSTIC